MKLWRLRISRIQILRRVHFRCRQPHPNSAIQLTSAVVKGYQMPTADTRRVKRALADQLAVGVPVTALQFFFAVTLGRGQLMAKMSHVHQPRKLPTVLGRAEVERLLEAAPRLSTRPPCQWPPAPDCAPPRWSR
jgi:hypothetical protein